MTPEARAREFWRQIDILADITPLSQEAVVVRLRIEFEQAVAEEREACAQIALQTNDCCECGDAGCHVGDLCPTAKAIRARSTSAGSSS